MSSNLTEQDIMSAVSADVMEALNPEKIIFPEYMGVPAVVIDFRAHYITQKGNKSSRRRSYKATVWEYPDHQGRYSLLVTYPSPSKYPTPLVHIRLRQIDGGTLNKALASVVIN